MRQTAIVTERKVTSGGFTLLEVMMAMAIFSIGILAVIGGQHLIVKQNTDGNVTTQQIMLAQRILEEMKNNTSPSSLTSSTQNNVDETGRGSGPYQVTRRVINALGSDSSRFIIVTVTKQGPGGHPITVQTVTQGSGV